MPVISSAFVRVPFRELADLQRLQKAAIILNVAAMNKLALWHESGPIV